MAPDDIPTANPASEMERNPKTDTSNRRSIGPESETRGGPEAPDKALVTPREVASDPPTPPGQPAEVPNPDPERPPPIEEPPQPIPIPSHDPPQPIVALLARWQG